MPKINDRMGTGERIAVWRNYRGLTQESCAGLVGKSLSWWKKIEGGTRRVEKLSDLVLIAQILKVRDITDLTGSLEFSLSLDRARDPALLPPVRDAVRQATMVLDRPDVDADDLRERIDAARHAFHRDSRFVVTLGRQLPDLILDATARHRAIGDRRAAADLSEVYLLTCQWARHVSAQDLALTVVDRASSYAHLSGDPVSIALSSWQMGGALKDAGRAEDGLDVVISATEELGRWVTDATYTRATYGHMNLQAALMAAHTQDEGTAWRHWDDAVEISRTLPPGYVEPTTIFNASHPGVFAIFINVALGKSQPAVEVANRFDIDGQPSAPVRSLTLLNVARGYAGKRDDVSTFHVLMKAERESPETIAQSGHAREMCREMMRRDRSVISRDLHEFARRIGLFA